MVVGIGPILAFINLRVKKGGLSPDTRGCDLFIGSTGTNHEDTECPEKMHILAVRRANPRGAAAKRKN
jgi:hypothetical protein